VFSCKENHKFVLIFTASHVGANENYKYTYSLIYEHLAYEVLL